MDQQFGKKIERIKAELNTTCFIKTSEFDKACKEEKILQEAKGATWNKYTHKNSGKFGFEIWKNDANENFYVKSNKECTAKAEDFALTPFTNKQLYRGEERAK